MKLKKGEVIQFAQGHKWAGCLGIVDEVKDCGKSGTRYMVCVPVPDNGGKFRTAYIFAQRKELYKLLIKCGLDIYQSEELASVALITPFNPEEEEEE